RRAVFHPPGTQSLVKIGPKCSIFSSALPEPRTTQVSGSSAPITGSPVSSISSRSRSSSSAPPPVSRMPFSAMSGPSTGGAGAGADRAFADRAARDLGRAAGHADDDARRGREQLVVVHFLDELLEHLLGDGEVGDDAVLHRPDGDDVAGSFPEHLLRLPADR